MPLSHEIVKLMKRKIPQRFKLFLLPGILGFLSCIFFKIMQVITNLTENIQKKHC